MKNIIFSLKGSGIFFKKSNQILLYVVTENKMRIDIYDKGFDNICS